MTLAKEVKRKMPPAESRTAANTDPSAPQRFAETDNAAIEEIMAVILRHGLSADHAKLLLGRTIQLLEWGKQAANKRPEANA